MLLFPRKTLLLAALCASLLPQAFAQSAPPAPSPAASAPLPEYRSAFDTYRPFVAGDVRPWRQTNDTVRDIGGWRAYAREINGATAPPESAVPAMPAGAAMPMHGHMPSGHHGGHAK